jgi:hypothetical protein
MAAAGQGAAEHWSRGGEVIVLQTCVMQLCKCTADAVAAAAAAAGLVQLGI